MDKKNTNTQQLITTTPFNLNYGNERCCIVTFDIVAMVAMIFAYMGKKIS